MSRAHHKSHINNDSNMHGQNSIGFNIFRFRMRISHEELLEESLGLKGLEFSVYSSQLEANGFNIAVLGFGTSGFGPALRSEGKWSHFNSDCGKYGDAKNRCSRVNHEDGRTGF